jgi:signal transduction histidine kinase
MVSKGAIGFILLGSELPGFFNQETLDRLVAFASPAAVAIQNAWLFEQVQAGHERLQSLSRRLVEIQESERSYIARELHDEAGQALSSLIYTICLLEHEANDSERVLALSDDLKRVTDTVLENLHRLATDLRPASLDHLGLAAAIEQYVLLFTERSQLEVKFKIQGFDHERLPPEVETTLYRIVQEAMANIARHAQATHVDVYLEKRKDQVIVVIEDNGKGFDTSQLSNNGHLGLMGMQERAEMLGGRLEIESEPGMGTTIFVGVPYGNPHPYHR